MIKAPFNFVPLNETVFFPEWADEVSHDIPFEDGESGEIEIRVTAHSPIFVRNGHVKDKKDKYPDYASFSKIDDTYFIPGTSIKGTIRSVLEIMSFGKMTQVADDSFGKRDINDRTYRDLMQAQHCGWLQLIGDTYYLTDCGIPGRISLSAIDKEFGTDFEAFALNRRNFSRDSGRTAKAKYEKLGNNILLEGFFEPDNDLIEKMRSANPVDKRNFVKFVNTDKTNGTLVLTGQPGVRALRQNRDGKEKWSGKFYEFVFFDKVEKKHELALNSGIIKAFKTVHKNSPDYKEFWGIRLNKGEKIPVFFQLNAKNEIHSIGLSYLYKYPFEKSVYNGINDELKCTKSDLCDSLFGYTGKDSLKGRVQFGHAMGIKNIRPDTNKTITTSASPHASYYPLYLGKDRNNNLQNWDNATRIAGRKRYPIRSTVLTNTGTENMENEMYLLNANAVFSGKIRFHNLLPVEIGALLSALTFHHDGACFHNIGYGKPLGYGKVKIEASLKSQLKGNESKYMEMFEERMNEFLSGNWQTTPQLKELIAMAKGIPAGRENDFSYMVMSTDRNANEFISGKRDYDAGRMYLQSYTEIINRTPLAAVGRLTNAVQNGNRNNRPNNDNNRNRPQPQPQRNRSIAQQEEEYEWELELEEEYHAYIKENRQIMICHPDRNVRGRNILCKYEIDEYCRINRVNPGDAAKIEVLEKDGNVVIININSVERNKR